ncbi:uncharacterized protein B0H18DRAFT_1116164 [Fomitopsis serialis]|uniref:uncharacterized protein n=1 Tax=Fomitopsis serialis TaxID=139415 RepID=UPI002008E489|nr:uncharacterized protein B0H18DRAFT_1116164 [Neoantrodia serialis]KAH9931921.1 hypothetical protein B0H18DRAFT_1116164 [Neoantrodia serialis]
MGAGLMSYGTLEVFIVGTYAQTIVGLDVHVSQKPKIDPWWIPSVVSLVWLLCTLCTAMDVYTVLYFTVINHAVSLSSETPPWSLSLLTSIMTSTTTAVRLLYLSRIWRFHQKKAEWSILLVVDIVVVAVLSLLGICEFPYYDLGETGLGADAKLCTAGGIVISVYRFHPQSMKNPSHLRRALEATLAAGICADVLLVVTLCLSLYRARSGLRRTDSALTLFILYTIYNGTPVLNSVSVRLRLQVPSNLAYRVGVGCSARLFGFVYAHQGRSSFPFYIQIGNLFLIGFLNHRKTVRSRIQRELDLNYDAFDMVPDSATCASPPTRATSSRVPSNLIGSPSSSQDASEPTRTGSVRADGCSELVVDWDTGDSDASSRSQERERVKVNAEDEDDRRGRTPAEANVWVPPTRTAQMDVDSRRRGFYGQSTASDSLCLIA